MTRPRIAVITTISMSIKAFYSTQLRALQDEGFEVTVLCAPDPTLPALLSEGVRYIPVPFTRRTTPSDDLNALWSLYHILRRERFDIVQYSTLKASLIGSMAAFLARVPHRLYLLWGLYYEGQREPKRGLLKALERQICALSTEVLPNSYEMAEVIEGEGITGGRRCRVIHHGSACGVDLQAFCAEAWRVDAEALHRQAQIPEDAVVIGFVGRQTGDKGIVELVQAFEHLAREEQGIYLLLVGEQEEKDRLPSAIMRQIRGHARIKTLPFQEKVQPCLAAFDIICLPTYREGFPQTHLEAQAMKVPVVSTDIMGCREAVIDGETGYLVPPRDALALLPPLRELSRSAELRVRLGEQGHRRVAERFSHLDFNRAIIRHRKELLAS